MVKVDLVRRVMEVTVLESPDVRDAVDVLFGTVSSALARGDRVVLRRFGTLYTSPRRTGMARNPRTNEPVGIPRGRAVRFRPAPNLSSVADGS